MRIFAAGLSDAGVTRATNDDHYCIGPFVEQGSLTSLSLDTASVSFQRHGLLAAVADGMGSYAGGAIASRILLETLSALFYGQQLQGNTPDELREQLAGCLQQAQEVLRAYLLRDEKLHEAGTTLAGLVLLPPDICLVFHLGDSRVLREAAGYVRQLDHPPGQLKRLDILAVPEHQQRAHEAHQAAQDRPAAPQRARQAPPAACQQRPERPRHQDFHRIDDWIHRAAPLRLRRISG